MTMSTGGGASKRKATDEGDEDSNYTTLSIISQDGRRLFFKVNSNSSLIKVFREYCDRMNLEYGAMRFLYNGQRINAKQSAKKLKIENNDEILAAENVLGGGVAALSFYQHDIHMAL